mmetsp:Transcript_40371/g.111217  ORF Transcript_40371/g.111217 Transcript_40371/m.111217 type:complete len:213 (-) Transcript_40371:907-1545(-)
MLGILNVLDTLVEVVLETLDDRLAIRLFLALRHDLVLQALLLCGKLLDVLLELFLLPVVILKLGVHELNLFFHVGNAVVLRIDLCLELLDLVVQHELEFLELLILLLQVVNPLLLNSDGVVALLYLPQIVFALLLQLVDLLLLFACLVLELLQLLPLFLHVPLELLVIPLVDPRLSPQAHLVLPLGFQPQLLLFFELLDFAVCVLLQLSPRL